MPMYVAAAGAAAGRGRQAVPVPGEEERQERKKRRVPESSGVRRAKGAGNAGNAQTSTATHILSAATKPFLSTTKHIHV